MRLTLALFFVAALSLLVVAQTVKFEDVPKRSGVQVGYNRFSDQTILATKRAIVDGVVGKKSILNPGANTRILEMVAGVMFPGRQPEKPLSEVAIVIYPNVQTTSGRMFRGLGSGGSGIYFAPNSKIVAIADEERIALGEIAKPESLDVFGRYDGAAMAAVPLEAFRKIANAKKLEMAVGSIEIRLIKRNQELFRNLLMEIDARQPRTAAKP